MNMENPYHKQTLAKILENPHDLKSTLNERFPLSRTVLVKGVYDLFHSGHYYSFIKAKTYGDILIVAVNSDAAVKNRKGEKRPIINQQERMLLVAALTCTDWVTLYEQESPYELLRVLHPNVFVASHFDSITKQQMAEIERHTLLQRAPKIENISTSQIIRKILGE
jgi:rfaE bifunctional protein nucleotidyltransferase chain/domain